MNLTGMLDMLNRLAEELEATKERQRELGEELNTTKSRQLETEKELNATREILKIGKELIVKNCCKELHNDVSFTFPDHVT